MSSLLSSDSKMLRTSILIIGAGPTGLGAASRLSQHGRTFSKSTLPSSPSDTESASAPLSPLSYLVVDSSPVAGGLSATHTTPEGFLFDLGGHVIFSHYQYFDDLLDSSCGGSGPSVWNSHERVSYVWMKNRYIPYPFQNNLASLDVPDQVTCLVGLSAALARPMSDPAPLTFDDWILKVMGVGIADVFMRPYNFKVWAYPTTHLQCGWLGERVATVDVSKAISNALHKKKDCGWGPNATFRFPKSGGTGGIWRSVAEKHVPAENLLLGREVVSIDLPSKIATLSDGRTISYDKLLSTIPLDETLRRTASRPDLADRLKYSSTHVVGIGVRGVSTHENKCWLYYPESDCSFYRCTVFSHYSENNCPAAETVLPTIKLADGSKPSDAEPRAGPYWSLMFEVSESSMKPVSSDLAAVIAEVLQGAINVKLLLPSDEVVSVFHRRLEKGYPTPCLDRDAVLKEVLPMLRDQHSVWSRGRFGAWKYEVANQDHSCMQGVEAVDNMLFGTAEITLEYPNICNAGAKNKQLKFDGGGNGGGGASTAAVSGSDDRLPLLRQWSSA